MAANHRDTLRNVRSIEQLVEYLRDELGWPIQHADMDDISELVFDVNPTQLGLKPDVVAKIEQVMRFRPLDHNQPWAIYYVEFAPNNLPVAALRRILNSLSVRQRSGITNQTSNFWRQDDLLFISQYGEDSDRRITFAHFLNTPGKKDLPTLKVLGWDGDDTNLTLDAVAETLKTKLRWPSNTSDVASWKMNWRSAFQLGHREQITTAKLMADRLANVARNVRSRIEGALAVENDNGPLHLLMKSFKESLISDLTEASFADMFAQTISYGLLSARIANGSAKTADELASAMPITSPFLKELMAKFLDISGRKTGTTDGLDYDELGISEVVDLLDQANMEAVLRDFGNRNKDEDPVMHFFEGFLQAYDKRIRKDRGVFYTPQPVVSYIVRSVHELLQTEFGLEDGLADTTTWGEMLKKHPEMKLPPLTDSPGEKRTISPDEPFVQILDPATGTATFLVEVIDVIYKTLIAKWTKERKSATDQITAWNKYVPNHLLPRLHAYELMMAPYAIAHMKVGLKLKETGYQFESNVRAQIYLTNALEAWTKQLPLIGFDALAHEAEEVNKLKRNKRFSVVIGNPPYSLLSANLEPHHRALIEDYKFVNGERIHERGALQLEKNLNDDYVKFVRLTQQAIVSAGVGVSGLITNHSFLDNPTMRGMRWSLLQSTSLLWLIDLHGNSTKQEQPPSGVEDVNVFHIKQGVAIALSVRLPWQPVTHESRHHERWGSRHSKETWLGTNHVGSHEWKLIEPTPDYFLFIPQSSVLKSEVEGWQSLPDAMPVNGAGYITARDNLVIDFERDVVNERILDFKTSSLPDYEILREFDVAEKKGWDIGRARADLKHVDIPQRVISTNYRPFYARWIFFDSTLVWGRSWPTMQHVVGHPNNLTLLATRMTKDQWDVWVSRTVSSHKAMSAYDTNSIFPLYLASDSESSQRSLANESRVNFSMAFLKTLASILGLEQTATTFLPSSLTPEDIFHYIYAVLRSPAYRSRYADFLKIDFPRLPLTGSIDLFRTLSALGGQLVALHLVESEAQNTPITKYIGNSTEVVKPGWTNDNGGTVWLDTGGTKAKTTAGTRGFVGVTEDVWNFHIGGYQVCEKWLKDRKGRTLSDEDISHYHKIIVALSETIRIMKEIDDVIEQHGGWPGAFQTGSETSSAPVEYKYAERTPKAAEGTLFED